MVIEEYSRGYAWRNIGKNETRDLTLYRNNANVWGNMDEIGQITRVELVHWHLSGKSADTYRTVFDLRQGSTVISGSDTAEHTDVGTSTPKKMVNVLSSIPESVADFDRWDNVRLMLTYKKYNSYKYFVLGGYSGKNVDLIVYYYRKQDLCPDAAPPTIGTTTYTDLTLVPSTGNSIRDEFGAGYLQGSHPVLTTPVALDFAKYDYITATADVTVTDQNGSIVFANTYRINYDNRNVVADIGVVDTIGTYNFAITVTDASGNVATKTGSFAVSTYRKPTAQLTVLRYGSTLDAAGNVTYAEDMNGEFVRFWLKADALNCNSRNTLTAVLTYGTEDRQLGTVTIANLSGSSLAINSSEQSYLGVSARFDVGLRYWFTVTISDKLSSASDTQWIDIAGADFDMEPGGVAVGKIAEGTPSNPMFEVAYPMIRYGLYDSNEHMVGTIRYNDTEVPVYEQMIIAENLTTENRHTANLVGTLSVGSDIDLVVDLRVITYNGDNWQGVTWWDATGNQYFEVSPNGDVRIVCYRATFPKIIATVRYTRKSDLI